MAYLHIQRALEVNDTALNSHGIQGSKKMIRGKCSSWMGFMVTIKSVSMLHFSAEKFSSLVLALLSSFCSLLL